MATPCTARQLHTQGLTSSLPASRRVPPTCPPSGAPHLPGWALQGLFFTVWPAEDHMYPKLRLKYKPNLISLAGGMQELPITKPEERAIPTPVRGTRGASLVLGITFVRCMLSHRQRKGASVSAPAAGVGFSSSRVDMAGMLLPLKHAASPSQPHKPEMTLALFLTFLISRRVPSPRPCLPARGVEAHAG